jgi:hypothetical protein
LQLLNFVYDSPPWNASDWGVGSVKAFHTVHDLLEAEDFEALEGLVEDTLLSKMQEDQIQGLGSRRVLDVQALGLFSSKLRPEISPPHWHQSVWVTHLLKAVEEYRYPDEAARPFHVERLHRWTFKRVLLSDAGEVMGPWQLVSVNKMRWELPQADAR